jgi:phosphohistidine phosphatase SixA
MRTIIRRGLFSVILLFFLAACEGISTGSTLAAASAPPTAAAAPTRSFTPAQAGGDNSSAVLKKLRGGGYVIYFRHAATDTATQDKTPVVLEDCATQRNLSSSGEAQAQEIGRAFARLEIPVGRVLASPFCRTLNTARIAFDQVEIEPDLANPETAADEVERSARTAKLRQLLAEQPAPGTNTVLVSHVSNLSAAAQITVAEGEAAIFQPNGAGGFALVAKIPWDEWAALEQ